MSDSLQSLGEFGLIDRLHAGLERRTGVQLGIGDDGAILNGLHQPVVTTDALIEGVHFRLDWTSARSLGRKAMAVNISDLTAMGARPVAAFICLGISSAFGVEQIEELYAGMEDAGREFDFTIAGGDTVRSPAGLMLSVTLIGESLAGGPLLRSGARPGDVLFVTGTLGDSAAGLEILLHGRRALGDATGEYLLRRHHEPVPRLAFMSAALALPGAVVQAGLDLSDGIAGDAGHLAKQSGVRVVLKAEDLPISRQCREAAALFGVDPVEWALSGGEDYELLMAVESSDTEQLQKVGREVGLSLTPVGFCEAGEPGVVIQRAGEVVTGSGGFQHF